MDLSHPLCRAHWIWPELTPGVHNVHAQFRHDFDLPASPRKAPFFITADQCYILYVNGRYVGRGPARGYQASWPYDEHDLGAFLIKGANWISIRAYNGGVSTFGYIHQFAAGMLCAGKWGKLSIRGGRDWLTRFSPAQTRQTGRLSIQTNFQEHFDSRMDDQSWIHGAKRPARWGKPGFCKPFGVMPWHDLEPRGIPNLGQEMLAYRETVSATNGKCGPGYKDWPNIATGIYYEQKMCKWRRAKPGKAEPDGLTIALPANGEGKFSAVTIDLGQPAVGTLLVDIPAGQDGPCVDFYFSEVANADDSPVVTPPGKGCNASMATRLWPRTGKLRYETFQMIGHRYVTAILRDASKPLTLKLAMRHTTYPLDIAGSFRTDDEVLNDIHDICTRTQQVCMLDSYVDTPWREQAQWWGDARVQAYNTFHLAGDSRLLARGIRSIARQEVPNGLTFGHAPTMAYNCVLPDFSLTWALTIWDYYWQTGDVGLFREQWPRIERMLGYFTGEGAGDSGLLRHDERYWLFLDWCDIHREGSPALLNLWYAMALEKLLALAKIAKMAAPAKRLATLNAKQKKLVERSFWDAKAGLFRDGLFADGRPTDVHSIHTQTLAILCGLAGDQHTHMAERVLLPYLRGEPVDGAQPSSFWVTYVYDAARRLGHAAEVVAHIRAKWAAMIGSGGTWEVFEPEFGNHSVTHAWAAHPIFHLAGTLGGVTQTDVAWRRVALAPCFDMPGVNNVSLVIPTPAGKLSAAWKRDGKRIDVRLALPKSVKAEVHLPGVPTATVTGTKQWRLDVE